MAANGDVLKKIQLVIARERGIPEIQGVIIVVSVYYHVFVQKYKNRIMPSFSYRY